MKKIFVNYAGVIVFYLVILISAIAITSNVTYIENEKSYDYTIAINN